MFIKNLVNGCGLAWGGRFWPSAFWVYERFIGGWMRPKTAEEMRRMEYITVTKENLEQEPICCALSNHKDAQVSSKKEWLKNYFDDGLVFLKSAEKGKSGSCRAR